MVCNFQTANFILEVVGSSRKVSWQQINDSCDPEVNVGVFVITAN